MFSCNNLMCRVCQNFLHTKALTGTRGYFVGLRTVKGVKFSGPIEATKIVESEDLETPPDIFILPPN